MPLTKFQKVTVSLFVFLFAIAVIGFFFGIWCYLRTLDKEVITHNEFLLSTGDLIYNPEYTGNQTNVFNDFNKLMDVVEQHEGHLNIWFESTTAEMNIPPKTGGGAYNMTDVTLCAHTRYYLKNDPGTGKSLVVNVQDGVFFKNLFAIDGPISLTYHGTNPCMHNNPARSTDANAWLGPNHTMRMENGATLVCLGSAPFMEIWFEAEGLPTSTGVGLLVVMGVGCGLFLDTATQTPVFDLHTVGTTGLGGQETTLRIAAAHSNYVIQTGCATGDANAKLGLNFWSLAAHPSANPTTPPNTNSGLPSLDAGDWTGLTNLSYANLAGTTRDPYVFSWTAGGSGASAPITTASDGIMRGDKWWDQTFKNIHIFNGIGWEVVP